jgi:RES domain-containing protein
MTSITAWRIVKSKHTSTAFSGEGARREGGRWNSVGIPVVYLAESVSLAVLEMLVHLEGDELLKHYRVIPASFPRSLVKELDPKELSANWKKNPAPISTQRLGDQWIASRASVVLKVPSIIVARESNYLLNPHHPQFKRVHIGRPESFRFDQRLKR